MCVDMQNKGKEDCGREVNLIRQRHSAEAGDVPGVKIALNKRNCTVLL